MSPLLHMNMTFFGFWSLAQTSLWKTNAFLYFPCLEGDKQQGNQKMFSEGDKQLGENWIILTFSIKKKKNNVQH